MFKTIIFDWSGTLSDDFALCFDAANRLLARFGKPRISRREFQRVYTADVKDFYASRGVFLSRRKLFEEYARVLEASKIKPKPFPESRRVLQRLRKKKIGLFVVSAHPTRVLLKETRAYGFARFFTEVVGGVWFKEKAIKKILREHGVKARDALFVSDVTLDVASGKKAGVRVVAVTYGYHPRAWLARSRPDYLIKNLDDLLKLV